MNKPIRIMSVVCLMLFLALMVNITYVQFVQAKSLNARNDNKRIINEEFSRDRGPILVGDEAVAESKPVDDEFEYQRKYTHPNLYAPLTGYYSYEYSRRGIENSQNGVLSGTDDRLFVNRVVDLLANRPSKGGSTELTIDPVAQKAAANGLKKLGKGTKGAVVALEPSTGEVQAMVSLPSYDPNRLATHDFDSATKAWKKLNNNDNQPMLNRATQRNLPPGSIFKIVTAAAAIEKHDYEPSDKVKGGYKLTFPGMDYSLPNDYDTNCGGDKITFGHALEVSCNVSFGWLADKVGEDDLVEQAEKFGFGSKPFDELESASSHVVEESEDLTRPQLAQTGIGQYEVATNPLQMAMVTGGIANGGVVMKPQLISKVRAPNLSVIENNEPQKLNRAMSESNADMLSDMMVDVVDNGSGREAKISGVDVGGKTGTAQSTEDRPPYAWFVSFAPADDPDVAVAVVVEANDSGEASGSRVAGPIAHSVMEAILK